MSKRYVFRSKFHVCHHILDMKVPGEESLLTVPVPSRLIITRIKNDKLFFLHFLMLFSPLFGIRVTRVKTIFVKCISISVSLTTEIHQNRT